MTRGSLVSKVVCADILLFKCQSVNYANGLQGPCINIYTGPFMCTQYHISCELLETASPCFNIIKKLKYEMTPPAAASLPLHYPSQMLRPSLSSSPVLFFLVVQLFVQRCYATLASFREGESTLH